MREITTHQASPLDNHLTLHVTDSPGAGNANHQYVVHNSVQLKDNNGNLNADVLCFVHFQNGPIKEAGINGVSNKILLAIVADRLEGFQTGTYACEDNGIALAKVKSAMEDLQTRTKARLGRGAEGTSIV